MEEMQLQTSGGDPDAEARQRRLELARKAFQEYFALCFWSWSEETEITEETIPLIVEGLRHHGGHRGYLIAAQLCLSRPARPTHASQSRGA